MARGDVHIPGVDGLPLCGVGGQPIWRRGCAECEELQAQFRELLACPPAAAGAGVGAARIHRKASAIVSMTTIPPRIHTVGGTVTSLRRQVEPPGEIRLYLGPDCPDFVDPDPTSPVRVVVRRVEDRGPVTKLSAVGDPEVRKDATVVTVDDDIIFHPEWFRTLLRQADAHPEEAIGLAGWNASVLLETGRYERAAGTCDVIEGFAGVAYKKWFFDVDVLDPPPEMKYVDDPWISHYLDRAGVVRRVVPGAGFLVDVHGSVPSGLHTRPDFHAANRNAATVYFGRPHRSKLLGRRAQALGANP